LAPGKTNYVRFRLSPDVAIAIGAQVKRPGEQMISEPAEFMIAQQPHGDEMGPYERLLGDALDGDATFFAREDSVEAAWSIVGPVLGDVTPAVEYAPGSWGPREAEQLTADVGGWHEPTA
ncbi:MAG: glucose-6-phosphate dehydrogenase, partial [Gemmatimonadota bacterium]